MVLDYFVSVITADTKDYEAGAKKVEKSTDEIAESMKNAEKQAQDTTEKLKKAIKGIAGFLGTYYAISETIGTAINQADNINTLNQVATSLETNVENLDAFTKALKENGAEAEATEDALRNAFNSSAEAINNAESEQAKIFKQLGISLNNADGSIKDTTLLLTELAGATEQLDKRQANNIFQKLGITDKRVIDGLLKGRKELEENIKKQKENGVITKRQVEIAEKYKQAQDRLNSSLENAKNSIMEYIAPAITWLIDKFKIVVDWANKHQAFIIGFFGTIAAFVSAVYLPAMIRAGIATMVAFAPVIGIATLLGLLATAIALVVDDIKTFIEGGDSLTGRIIEWFKQFGNFSWDSFLASWSESMDKMAHPFIVLGNIISETFTNIKNSVSENFNSIKEIISAIIDTILGTIAKIKDTFNGVKSFFGFGDGDANLELANKTITDIQANPLNKVSSQQISNMSNSKNEQNIGIGEITINTQATSSKEISSDIKSDLQNQLQNLKAESYSGIDI